MFVCELFLFFSFVPFLKLLSGYNERKAIQPNCECEERNDSKLKMPVPSNRTKSSAYANNTEGQTISGKIPASRLLCKRKKVIRNSLPVRYGRCPFVGLFALFRSAVCVRERVCLWCECVFVLVGVFPLLHAVTRPEAKKSTFRIPTSVPDPWGD